MSWRRIVPLEMLSGGRSPRESMPAVVQWIMLAAPTTHFVALGQAVCHRRQTGEG